jgi:MULE transposase domain
VSNVLQVYRPAKAGNAKQFAEMTKSATGIALKNGQANLAVKGSGQDTIEAHMGQYFWIPSLLQAYKESDDDGSFVLEYTNCVWRPGVNQFHRLYIALSIAKTFWYNAGIGLVSCDGTFTKNNYFKHIILICTTMDANNQIVILAFAIVDCEDADNWVWYKEQLEQDFPGISV